MIKRYLDPATLDAIAVTHLHGDQLRERRRAAQPRSQLARHALIESRAPGLPAHRAHAPGHEEPRAREGHDARVRDRWPRADGLTRDDVDALGPHLHEHVTF